MSFVVDYQFQFPVVHNYIIKSNIYNFKSLHILRIARIHYSLPNCLRKFIMDYVLYVTHLRKPTIVILPLWGKSILNFTVSISAGRISIETMLHYSNLYCLSLYDNIIFLSRLKIKDLHLFLYCCMNSPYKLIKIDITQ